MPRKELDDAPEIITIQEVARLPGVREPALRRREDRGSLPARRYPDGCRLYDRAKMPAIAMRKRS